MATEDQATDTVVLAMAMAMAVACIVDRCRYRSSSEAVTDTVTEADSAWAAVGGAADGVAVAATEEEDSVAVEDSLDREMEEDLEEDDFIKR